MSKTLIIKTKPVNFSFLSRKYKGLKKRKVGGFDLEVGTSSRGGRGVFAKRSFEEGEIVEICPLLLIKNEFLVNENEATCYVYQFSKDYSSLALGYGSLYNHSTNSPNIECTSDHEKCINTYRALRDIEDGEELLLNYTGQIGVQHPGLEDER